jgi:hypothetical protein
MTIVSQAPSGADTSAVILARIEVFLSKRGMTASGFGIAAAGDSHLVHQMRKGRRPGNNMVSKILAFLDGAPPARCYLAEVAKAERYRRRAALADQRAAEILRRVEISGSAAGAPAP